MGRYWSNGVMDKNYQFIQSISENEYCYNQATTGLQKHIDLDSIYTRLLLE